MVRFSPSERAELDRKAAVAKQTRSELIRAAVVAYQPSPPKEST